MGRNLTGVAAHRRRCAVGPSVCKTRWRELQGRRWGRLAPASIFPGDSHELGRMSVRDAVRSYEYARDLGSMSPQSMEMKIE